LNDHLGTYDDRDQMDFAPAARMTPTTIIAGAEDELMFADKYAEIVRGIEPRTDVKITLDAIAATLQK
jgi:hypothetical protein